MGRAGKFIQYRSHLDPCLSFAIFHSFKRMFMTISLPPIDAGRSLEVRRSDEWHTKRDNDPMRPKCQYLYHPCTSSSLRARISHFQLAKRSFAHLDHDIPDFGDPLWPKYLHRPQHARHIEWPRGHGEYPRRDEPR